MNRQQYEAVSSTPLGLPQISVADLGDTSSRTLLYGYDTERHTFHVYLQGGELHRHVYDYSGATLSHEYGSSLDAESLIPNKRTYPQWTDYDFVLLLASKGFKVFFANYQDPSEADFEHKAQFAPYFGRTA